MKFEDYLIFFDFENFIYLDTSKKVWFEKSLEHSENFQFSTVDKKKFKWEIQEVEVSLYHLFVYYGDSVFMLKNIDFNSIQSNFYFF